VEVVGDATGQLAHRLHLLRLMEQLVCAPTTYRLRDDVGDGLQECYLVRPESMRTGRIRDQNPPGPVLVLDDDRGAAANPELEKNGRKIELGFRLRVTDNDGATGCERHRRRGPRTERCVGNGLPSPTARVSEGQHFRR